MYGCMMYDVWCMVYGEVILIQRKGYVVMMRVYNDDNEWIMWYLWMMSKPFGRIFFLKR